MAERKTQTTPAAVPQSAAVVQHTNRKGVTYYLHQRVATMGKARYYFAPRLHEHPLTEIPAGYAISEGVNGVVSLVKDRPPIISTAERAEVESALRALSTAGQYQVVIKGKHIDVFELVTGAAVARADYVAEVEPRYADAAIRARVAEWAVSHGRYTSILRFILLHQDSRVFSCERWCYRSSVNGWLPLGRGSLPDLVHGTIPLLGSDAFFNLSQGSVGR